MAIFQVDISELFSFLRGSNRFHSAMAIEAEFR
jgi:hypothetical protein